MPMQLDLILFSDWAGFTQDNKLCLMGEFQVVMSAGPTAFAQGMIVARMSGAQADIGPHSMGLRVVSADGHLLVATPSLQVTLGPARFEGIRPTTWLISPLPPIPLPVPGIYCYEVIIDGVRQSVVGEIHVVKVKAA